MKRTDRDERRVLAVSAEATLADLHLGVLGAFDYRGGFTQVERVYRFCIDGVTYENGRGSRTALRRLLRDELSFMYACDDAPFEAECTVERSYEVRSRRHYPKVLSGDEHCDPQSATWRAQMAMRREYRDFEDARPALPLQSAAYRNGFFTAIISGPITMPSEWIPLCMELNAESADALNLKMRSLMAEYNAVATSLQEGPDTYRADLERLLTGESDGTALVHWAQGYVRAMGLRGDFWLAALRDSQWRRAFEPIATVIGIAESPDKHNWLRDTTLREGLATTVGMSAVVMREFWRDKLFPPRGTIHRTTPKISPNASCSCGSGKKYKRCCGSPLRIVN